VNYNKGGSEGGPTLRVLLVVWTSKLAFLGAIRDILF